MDNARGYRIIGTTFVWLWVISMIICIGHFWALNSLRVAWTLTNWKAVFFTAVFDIGISLLLNVFCNPLLAVGSIFFRLADRSEIPPKKYLWHHLTLPYTIITILLLIYVINVGFAIRRTTIEREAIGQKANTSISEHYAGTAGS